MFGNQILNQNLKFCFSFKNIFSTKLGESLDKNGGLDGHEKGTGDLDALEGLGGAELLTGGHETGHFD